MEYAYAIMVILILVLPNVNLVPNIVYNVFWIKKFQIILYVLNAMLMVFVKINHLNFVLVKIIIFNPILNKSIAVIFLVTHVIVRVVLLVQKTNF
jgi:hypothetical protein